jgi:cbb3-type cytochrome oxidase subunit 3
MFREVLSSLENVTGAIAALLIFSTCFAGFCFWTYQKNNKTRYEDASELPLTDGELHESR